MKVADVLKVKLRTNSTAVIKSGAYFYLILYFTMVSNPKIMVADDHSMTRKGIRHLLERYADISEVDSCENLLKKLRGGSYSHLILDAYLSEGDLRYYYISKSTREEETAKLLLDFIRNVKRRPASNIHGGNPFMSLSGDQLIILNYWLAGHRGKDIAVALNVKKNTISTQKRRILEKTGAANDSELRELARAYKIVL